ncbi:MAG: hypothetical protein ACAI44_27970 [Candidatus Sericytochromatia bacterium]
MGDLKLQGHSGFFGKEEPVQHRTLNKVSDQDIKGMTQDNNLDEIVVQTPDGQKHIAYADELSVKDGALPKVGDKVSLPFLDDEATVLHVDDEWNEDLGMAGATVIGGLGGLGAATLYNHLHDTGGTQGSDAVIRVFSRESDISRKEIKWVKENLDKTGFPESMKQSIRKIFEQSGKLEALAKQAALAAPAVSQDDLNWALQLEQKVKETDYMPSAEEQKRYEKIATDLQALNQASSQAPSQAPSSEAADIDWAVQLQDKVANQGYVATDAELKRYEQIYLSINPPAVETKVQDAPAPVAAPAPKPRRPRKTD